MVEIIFTLTALVGFLLALYQQQWLALPLLLVYLSGLGWVSGQSIWEALQWFVTNKEKA